MAITTHITDITIDFTITEDYSNTLNDEDMAALLSLFDDTLGKRFQALGFDVVKGPSGTVPWNNRGDQWMGITVDLVARNMTPLQSLSAVHAVIGEEETRFGTIKSITFNTSKTLNLRPIND